MTGRWANHEEIGSGSVFEGLHSGLTVSLIATPRDELMTCGSSEPVADVMARNTEPYDYLPVLASAEASGGQIIGLFPALNAFALTSHEGNIKEHLIPLSEGYVIGADGSILEFIKDVDERPCRLVISGARIVGLVSLSDLQKLPVRAALFALITGFEITMFEAIKRVMAEDGDWLRCLSAGRQDKIQGEIAISRADNGFVDALLFTQFCDKADIVAKMFALSSSKRDVRDRLKDIQDLRDDLAHANEYAASPDHARNVCAVVRSLLALRQEIAAAGQTEAEPMRASPVLKGVG